MPDAVWTAAAAFGDAFKELPTVRRFRRAFDLAGKDDHLLQRVSSLTAHYSPLRTHPMLLGPRLNQLPQTAELLQSADDKAWLHDAVEAGTAFQVAIEFLRSRLPGYPTLRLPHLRDGSPHVPDDPFFVEGFPWDPELRKLGLQLSNGPDLTRLGGDDACQDELHQVAQGLAERLSWRKFGDARAALTDADRRELTEVAKEFSARVDDEAIFAAAGNLLMAQFEYRRAALWATVESVEGRVGAYLQAFEAVDELITVVVAFIETLITSGALLPVEPYRLDVEQGSEMRAVEFAVRGDSPFHSPGEILLLQGPHPELSGLVYPTAITHKWGRLDKPESAKMLVSGKLAVASS